MLRLSELALVYRAYEAERERRGALDFGEQVAAVIRLFRERPNVLRRWQRRFRYLLVDEFQDANVAQIELIELLGRTPDRPDNVMVVGDDDQSIYRFRGASYAAFVEFDRRFADPPAHDPDGPAPGAPTRLRIVENFRSRPPILVVANRLISRNELRYEPDKRLAPHRDGNGAPAVELVTCAGPDDEAAAIVERIKALAAWDPASGGQPAVPWSSFAVLYRKHKHREAIVARLREESIPYTVSGGLSLFATPEIRDLEQALRTIADPFADVALARILTAGPWRLDALELLAITRAANRAKPPPPGADPRRGRDRRGDARRGDPTARSRDCADGHRRRMGRPLPGRRRRDPGAGRRGPSTSSSPGHPGEAPSLPRHARRAGARGASRGPLHDPRALPRADARCSWTS